MEVPNNNRASNTEEDIEGTWNSFLDAFWPLPGSPSFDKGGDHDDLHNLVGGPFDKQRFAGVFLQSKSNHFVESFHSVLHNDESKFLLTSFPPHLKGSDAPINQLRARWQEDPSEFLHGCSPLPVPANSVIGSSRRNNDISEMDICGSGSSTSMSMFLQPFQSGGPVTPATSPLIHFDHMHPNVRRSEAVMSNGAVQRAAVIHVENEPERQRLLTTRRSSRTVTEKSGEEFLQYNEEEAPTPNYCAPDSDALVSISPHRPVQSIEQAANGGQVDDLDAETLLDVMFGKASAALQASVEQSCSSNKVQFKERSNNRTHSKEKPQKEKGPMISISHRTEADDVDDGYKWRKYGQKCRKDSPYAKYYYKCSSKQCKMRKHVERLEANCVLTTYEWKHNHPPPHKKS
ncbi:hypothetical protein KP509_31G073300 [Ceratopteris richardii]|uniref:WRKY domain-containing protein n=1 Tax=Ceratopteris richardii TaxID=49495 RepID=A0A8T2QZ23_CERRI|nr:hypothetical protein KP509_31G073300 [Ceratopteris richardii]